MNQTNGWSVFHVDGVGPMPALREFKNRLEQQKVPAHEQLYLGAAGMLEGVPGDRLVTIITSGHRRDDGTGYFALSVSISLPAVVQEVPPPALPAELADTNDA